MAETSCRYCKAWNYSLWPTRTLQSIKIKSLRRSSRPASKVRPGKLFRETLVMRLLRSNHRDKAKLQHSNHPGRTIALSVKPSGIQCPWTILFQIVGLVLHTYRQSRLWTASRNSILSTNHNKTALGSKSLRQRIWHLVLLIQPNKLLSRSYLRENGRCHSLTTNISTVLLGAVHEPISNRWSWCPSKWTSHCYINTALWLQTETLCTLKHPPPSIRNSQV